MHLSRHHKAMFFTEDLLRPGDGSVSRTGKHKRCLQPVARHIKKVRLPAFDFMSIWLSCRRTSPGLRWLPFYWTVSMPHLGFMAPLQVLSLPDEMPVIDIHSL